MIRRVASSAVALLLAWAMQAGAQVIRPPIGTPRLPPAPAPVLSKVHQASQAIFAVVWFQVPDGVVSILVSRTDAAGTGIAVTPRPVPLSQVPTTDGQNYYWTDNTLGVMGTFTYKVAGVFADGRSGISAGMAYTPLITEPSSIRLTKPNPFTATLTFTQSKMSAQGYRLTGTGLPASGLYATVDVSNYRGAGAITVPNLAAGTYNWLLKAQYAPGIFTAGVPITVTMP